MAYILKACYFLQADNLVTDLLSVFCLLMLAKVDLRALCAFCLASERSVTSHFSTGNFKMKHRLINNDTRNKDNLDQTLGICHGKLEDAH